MTLKRCPELERAAHQFSRGRELEALGDGFLGLLHGESPFEGAAKKGAGPWAVKGYFIKIPRTGCPALRQGNNLASGGAPRVSRRPHDCSRRKARTPSFTVHINRAGKKTEVLFRDLVAGRTLISVYMRNNTSACDLQTASLVTRAGEFAKRGWTVVAVSRDTCASHAKYAEKIGAGFTLVSDPEDRFAKAVDSMLEKSMYGKKYLGPARAAYLFDGDGTVLAVMPKVDAAGHGPPRRSRRSAR